MFVLVAVLSGITLMVAWFIAWPAGLAWTRLLERLPAAQALRLARWTPSLMAAAVVAGVVVALAAAGVFDVRLGGALPCHCGPEDALHICLVHPTRAAPLLPFAVLVWLLTGPRLVRRLAALGQDLRTAGRARRLAASVPEAGGVRLLDLGRSNALTAGLRRPVVVADVRWWRALSSRERLIVRAHEQAHVVRRDPMTLAILRAIGACLPPVADSMVRWWRAAAEHAADRRAAAVSGDPLEVAEFLLRQQRLSAPPTLAFNGTATERRVLALVAQGAGRSEPEGELDRVAAGSLLLLLGGVACGAHLHRAIEHLINWLH